MAYNKSKRIKMNLSLDLVQCHNLGVLFSQLEFIPDNFNNPSLYPPKNLPKEDIANFFLVLVAIDHRTSSPEGHPFEATLKDRFYHGADLMYALARMKQKKDPQFFTPQKMSKVSDPEIKKWLSVKTKERTVVIREVEQRAALLRDLGEKMLNYGYRNALDILNLSEGYLKKEGKGLLELLSPFKAYSDPLQKKSFLFLKFMHRIGLIQIKDLDQYYLPIDNHLIRIAVRTGIVTPEDDVTLKLFQPQHQKNEVSDEDDRAIRSLIRQAYEEVIRKSKLLDPSIIDDFLWTLGRSHCLKYEKPICEVRQPHTCQLKKDLKANCEEGCPLRKICHAFTKKERRNLLEHKFLDTFYY